MAEKETYLQSQRSQIARWREKIDDLRTMAANGENGGRADINRRIADLHLRLKSIEEKVLALKLSSDAHLENIERTIDAAWIDLSRDFSRAVSAVG